MLHYVNDSLPESLRDWCISKRSFIRLLDYLAVNQYHTLTFQDFIPGKKTLQLPQNKIIITFDDCPKHLFDFAIPELLKRKMKACFYMPTAHIGGYNQWNVEEGRARVELMNEQDLLELSKIGMEIGSHSHHHIKLAEVKDEQKVKEEVHLSKEILERMLQKPVYSFAFPYASIPKNYRKILHDAGYYFGLSIYKRFQTNFALRRFGWYDTDTEESLKFKLSNRYKLFRALYDPIKKN